MKLRGSFMKEQYLDLRIKVSSIRNQIIELNRIHNDLNVLLKNSMLIDDKIYNSDLFNSFNVINNQIVSDINGSIIPIIDSKV